MCPNHSKHLSLPDKPNEGDVIYGRGNHIKFHNGNLVYRCLIQNLKHQYVTMKKKNELSMSVYHAIINQSPTKGRFLEECKCGQYLALDCTVATRKISQCFREKQRNITSNLTTNNVNQNVSMENQVLGDYVTVRNDIIDLL
jgi:hypothetical protein